MASAEWKNYVLAGRFKSERRKKRLVKKDEEKTIEKQDPLRLIDED